MCRNLKCKKYNNCYRAQAKPSERQSFSTFDLKRDKCFIKFEKSSGRQVKVDMPEQK